MLNWVDKQNGVDDVLAEDINSIANAVIETQEEINKIVIDQTYTPDSENAQSGKAVAEAVANEQKRSDNTFANALKGNKSGSAILIDDVSPVPHEMNVKVRSKNLLPYPFTYETVDSYGITFKDNKDGTITLNGKNDGTEISNYNLFYTSDKLSFLKPNTDYYLSCNLDNITRSLRTVKSDGTYTYYSYGNINFPPDETPDRLFIQVKTDNTTTYNNTVVKLQIELGTTSTAYTPYIPDLTAVKVSRYGKNLFDKSTLRVAQGVKNLAQTNNGFTFETASTKTTMQVTCDVFLSVGTYYCRGTVSSSDGLNGGWGVYDPIKGVYIINASSRGTVNDKFTITKSKTYNLSFFANYNSAVDVTMTFTNIQLELGTTATVYEPYKECAEYTPNADGTVNGITSLYPSTTLTTDTDGVIIDCEYNRDINKAFAALEAAIATNNS